MNKSSINLYSDTNVTLEITAKAIHNTFNYGEFDIYVVRETNKSAMQEHIVLLKNITENDENIFCRISSECIPGTVLNSCDCDCAEQNEISLHTIFKANRGIFIYLRQEGRGQGLTTKILGLANKNIGLDTIKAIEIMGLKSDIREYFTASIVLKYFNLKSVNLLTNNPEKINAIKKSGIHVSGQTLVNAKNIKHITKHLQAKKAIGHIIENL